MSQREPGKILQAGIANAIELGKLQVCERWHLGEKTNVADAHPEIVARLTKQIESARAELGDYNVLGTGARFYDEGIKRPKLVKEKSSKPDAEASKKKKK